MIIKIKKRDLIITSVILILFMMPIVYGAVVKKGFGIELWISNQLPTIMFDSGTSFASADPTEAGTTLVWFVFNVTDPDGEDNINETGTTFNITLGSPGFRQMRFNASCTNISKIPADNAVVFNCSVYMQYYDNNSNNWVINATAKDVNDATTTNDSETFNYNELSAMSFAVAWINFSSMNLGQNDQAAANPLILNNTGNDDFDQINITGAALIGVTTSSETIAAAQFAVNYTNAVAGDGLPLSTSPQIIPGKEGDGTANLTLTHGHTGSVAPNVDKGNQSLYFWVDVPASGLSAQKYNNTWNITVVDLP